MHTIRIDRATSEMTFFTSLKRILRKTYFLSYTFKCNKYLNSRVDITVISKKDKAYANFYFFNFFKSSFIVTTSHAVCSDQKSRVNWERIN